MDYLLTSALVYIFIINLIAFAAYGIDKGKARHGARRIPEKTLIGLAAFGGAIGALIGMLTFRHKTRKIKFTITVPAFTILWIAVTLFLIYKLISG